MAKPTVKDDRRAHIRAKRVLSIEYRLFKKTHKRMDNAWKLSITHDMSAGGLSFYTDSQFASGDLIELRVVLSGLLDIFNGYGRVIRTQKKKTGAFSFVALRFEEKPAKTVRSRTSSTRKKSSTSRKRI